MEQCTESAVTHQFKILSFIILHSKPKCCYECQQQLQIICYYLKRVFVRSFCEEMIPDRLIFLLRSGTFEKVIVEIKNRGNEKHPQTDLCIARFMEFSRLTEPALAVPSSWVGVFRPPYFFQ